MRSLVKKVMIFSLVGIMQIGAGASLIEAAPPLYNDGSQRIMRVDNHGRDNDRQREHDERMREEKERHEREMKRRPHESEREWRERQEREKERHERALREIAVLLVKIVIDY